VAERTIDGRFRLVERLGGGGMATVWAAEDVELDRTVAVKLLAPHADPARFEREARAVASLAHPNVCRVYDFGESEGSPYLVLEFLPGGTLEDRLRLRPGASLPDEETERIAAELAAGLAAAHAVGLVHRDLKPANVLFDEEGRSKIADFGLARMAGAGTLTESGTVLGTAAYISPEQAAGEAATAASDVYSFGVMLYRMLAGRLPFEASDARTLLMLHLREEPPPLETIRPDVPPRLAGLTAAALAKSPSERPPDGASLLSVLESGAAYRAPAADPTLVMRDAGRRPRARLLALLAAVLALATAGVGLAILATGDDEETPSSSVPDTTTAPTVETTEPTVTAPPTTSSTTQETTTEPTTTGETEPPDTTSPPPDTTEPPPTETEPPPTETEPPPTETEPPPTDTVPETETTSETETTG
jgi:serine/threonine-protein kinase